MGFDEGSEALDNLIADLGDEVGRNEAQTRFDLIDLILKDCLQWPRDSIRVEQSTESGFTDYELGDRGTLLIVEAKKEGTSFTLPAGAKSGVHNLDPILRDKANRPLRDAMAQVMSYCSSRGVSPAVVTNGRQWVAFLASRSDGVAPLEGKAIFFTSLLDVQSRFLTFWNHLSPQGIQAHHLFASLAAASTAPPAPLSSTLPNYPGMKRRNPMQQDLQIMGQLMLEDVPTSETYGAVFLRECYANSGALSSYAEVSREILQSSGTLLLAGASDAEAEPVASKKGINPNLSRDTLAAAMSHRPIILLGGVGVGKSTFIQHLIHIDARDVFSDAMTFLVDFGYEATLEDPASYTVDQIERQLRESFGIDIDANQFVEDLYRKELQRFDAGVYGQLKDIDPGQYAVKRIEHLAGLLGNRSAHIRSALERITKSRRKQIVIFLDNVDQRSREDQNRVFLVSNEIAAKWPATVFITLRPETFYESERYGAVSGYHPRVFTIAPPRADVMLKKRVDFAIKILETKGDVEGKGTSPSVVYESSNLLAFLKVLSRNFKQNNQFMAMIENLAGGNMRRALDFVTQFIGSGHVDTGKIIAHLLYGDSSYTIPPHEFLRSLLHGDGVYYDPQRSPIPNLFHISRPEPRGHFLLLVMLDFISRKGESRGRSGYVGVPDVIRFAQGLGFSVDAIVNALEYASKFRLIESPLSDAAVASAESCRITTVGAYCMRRFPQLFTYVDAIVVDTPILEPGAVACIKDESEMRGRLERSETFHRYLDWAWGQSGIPEEVWNWQPIAKLLKADIDLVRSRALRHEKPLERDEQALGESS